MSNKCTKPVVAAIGAAFAGSMMLSGAASAASNPFGLSELNGGYAQIASSHEGKCGAGKCGGDKKMEGKCGGDKKMEGKCGGDKKMEGKCGGNKSMDTKGAEGKCGAGKCGGAK